MEQIVKVGLAQINTIVGDIAGNVEKINTNILQAIEKGADIVVFPELTITGYPPEDLLLLPAFIRENKKALEKIIKTSDIIAVVGFVDESAGHIYNAAAVLLNGEVQGIYHKQLLPNYGVFDEKRYFTEGQENLVFQCDDFVFGVNICEDIWYQVGPTARMCEQGAEFIINISSSPYYVKKFWDRYQVLQVRNKEVGLPIVYVNLVGGQDELVFDGNSMVLSAAGELIAKAAEFEEDLIVVDLPITKKNTGTTLSDNIIKLSYSTRNSELSISPQAYNIKAKAEREEEEIYAALVLGLKDYFLKNRFYKAIIGLSGGIDSALTLAIAVDALGADKVIAVSMPTRFSSDGTKSDARRVAENFGVQFFELPIQELFEHYLKVLYPVFKKKEWDVTEENIQARIRGNILMAMANRYGGIVIATGNKSEMSMGYCTLYGDMVGGFAILKDVYKTMVYRLAKYRNELAGFDIIPVSIIERAPSAELRENQKDTDSLPPYEVLDQILYYYIERNYGVDEISEKGFDRELVRQVLETVDKNEYKRRQGPPGIKITKRAFGKDRRMPIVNRFIRK